jgi:hypothetical protein
MQVGSGSSKAERASYLAKQTFGGGCVHRSYVSPVVYLPLIAVPSHPTPPGPLNLLQGVHQFGASSASRYPFLWPVSNTPSHDTFTMFPNEWRCCNRVIKHFIVEFISIVRFPLSDSCSPACPTDLRIELLRWSATSPDCSLRRESMLPQQRRRANGYGV